MSQTTNRLLNLDIYGKTPVLQIGNSSSMKTYIGSVLSIVTYIFMFVLFIYFGLQVVLKERPRIIVAIMNLASPPPVYLSQRNFSFVMGLQNPLTYDQYIDESIYTITAWYNVGKRVTINGSSQFAWNNTKLNLIPCKIDHFPENYKKDYAVMPLGSMYCLDKIDFAIFGTFNNEAYSFMKFDVAECVNTTQNNNKCKDKETINKYLGGAFFSLAFTDISVDPSNITQPNQLSIGDSYTTVSNKIFTEIHHYMKIVQIKSDNGLVFEDPETKEYLQKDRILIMNTFTPSVTFVSYTIKLSTQLDNYSRSYLKVQDVAALIGGMINFLTTCGMILSYIYTDVKYNELLINQLYDFNDKPLAKHSNTANNPKMTKILDQSVSRLNNDVHTNVNLNLNNTNLVNSNINLNSLIANDTVFNTKLPLSSNKNVASHKDNHCLSREVLTLNKSLNNEPSEVKFNLNNDKSHVDNTFEIIKKKNSLQEMLQKKTLYNRVEFSCMEAYKLFLCVCCYKDENKMNFFHQAVDKIHKKLDIIHLLHAFDEIERIKFILLDDIQLHLFNFLPKRHIHNYQFDSHVVDINNPSKNKMTISNLQRFYSKIDEDRTHSRINDNDLINAFGKVKEKIKNNNYSYIDKKLVKLVEERDLNI